MNQKISSEKKLQLIQRIRKEHQINQDTIQGREAFLYGKNVPYEVFTGTGMGTEGELQPVSTFRFRAVISLFLFIAIYTAAVGGRSIFGIEMSQVYQAVETDYSANLFDFIDEIPYTLHE